MPTKNVLLPPANRNFSSFDKNSAGILAFGTKGSICFLDPRSTPFTAAYPKFIVQAHKGKIVSLSFCKCPAINQIVSLGDEGTLNVWDLETFLLCQSLKLERKELTKVVEWLYDSPQTVVFSVENGKIQKWNIKTNTYKSLKTGSTAPVSALKANASNPLLVAVGHTNGVISVINIEQDSKLYKLKAHSKEITCVSWSPLESEMVLSSSADNSVRMWKLGEEKPTWTYYAPINNVKDDPKSKGPCPIYSIYHPLNADIVLCTNTRGEIGEVCKQEEKPKFVPYNLGANNMSNKVSFSLISAALDTSNGKEHILYSLDLFRLSVWSIEEKKLSTQYSFLCGFVNHIDASALKTELVAFSTSDSFVRIWNSAMPGSKMDMTSIFVQPRARVTVASFHPLVENVIAFGTEEGRVGVIDMFKKRVAYVFETHHTNAIHTMSWAPCSKDPNNLCSSSGEFYLYSCGGGIIYINRDYHPKSNALDFDEISICPEDFDKCDKNHSGLCWNSDYTLLCISNFKGFVDIYTKELEFMTRFDLQMKMLHYVSWHPSETYTSPNDSPLRFWIACCGADNDIHVVDASKVSDMTDDVCTTHKKLTGHKKRVSDVCWSQHEDGRLASSSKDCNVMIWNVCTSTLIAVYTEHAEPLSSVQWSFHDPDVIFSGGMDGYVKMWKISEHPFSSLGNIPAKPRLKMMKCKPSFGPPIQSANKRDSQNASLGETSSNQEENEEWKESKDKDKRLDMLEMKKRLIEDKLPNDFADVHAKKSQTLFPHIAFGKKARSFKDAKECARLADILSVKFADQSQKKACPITLDKDDCAVFGLFVDQMAAVKMMEYQSENFEEANNIDCRDQLEIMAGNLKKILAEAAKNGKLTPYLVSLAPQVSYSFWLEMCEKYAANLHETNQPHASSTYYLMCGKVYEAINALADKELVIDALILARSRLPESDPLIDRLVYLCLKKYSSNQNDVGEAMCNLAMNEPLKAAKTLAHLPGPDSARWAAYICKKFDLEKLSQEYIFASLERCLVQCDWSPFKTLIEQEPSMEIYSILVYVHEALWNQIRQLKSVEGINAKEILSCNTTLGKQKFWSGSIFSDCEPFIFSLYNQLCSKGVLKADEAVLESANEALTVFMERRKESEITTEAHVSVALHLTKYILMVLLGKKKEAHKFFLKVFEVSCNVVFLPKALTFLMFPVDFYFLPETNDFQFEKMCSSDINILASDCYSLCESACSLLCKPEEEDETKFHLVSEDLLHNLNFITVHLCERLNRKDNAARLAAYFVASLVNDLEKSVSNRNAVVKCHVISNIKSNESKCIDVDETCNYLPTEFIPQELSKESPENTIIEKIDEYNKSVEDLISEALKEAKEKEMSLRELHRKENSPDLKDEFFIVSQTDTSNNFMGSDYENNKIQPSEISTTAYSPHVENDNIICKTTVDANIDAVTEEFLTGARPMKQCSPDLKDEFLILSTTDPIDSFVHLQEDKNLNIQSKINEETDSDNLLIKETILENLTGKDTDEAQTNNSQSETVETSNNHSSLRQFETPQLTIEDHFSSHKICKATENEKVHSQCLRDINLFNSIITIFFNHVCQDEYMLLHYFIKRLKYLNEELLSTIHKSKKRTTSTIDQNIVRTEAVDKTDELDKVNKNDLPSVTDGKITEDNLSTEKHLNETVDVHFGNSFGNIDCDTVKSSDVDNLGSEFVDNVTTELRSEISSIAGFIQYYKENSENCCYPNPFIPATKLLKMSFKVIQNSECPAARHEVHSSVHNIIEWMNKFSVKDDCVECEVCKNNSESKM